MRKYHRQVARVQTGAFAVDREIYRPFGHIHHFQLGVDVRRVFHMPAGAGKQIVWVNLIKEMHTVSLFPDELCVIVYQQSENLSIHLSAKKHPFGVFWLFFGVKAYCAVITENVY